MGEISVYSYGGIPFYIFPMLFEKPFTNLNYDILTSTTRPKDNYGQRDTRTSYNAKHEEKVG